MSDELPGLSVFYKDENGDVFHTYSTYARGLDLSGWHLQLSSISRQRAATKTRSPRWIGSAATIGTKST